MQTVRTMIAESRGTARLAIRAAIVAGCAFLICGCNTDQPQVAAVPDVPTDYRLRHPITISEADHASKSSSGPIAASSAATQRAEVLAFAQTWKHEATGGVVVDLPVGTSNAACGGGGHARDSLDPGGERRAAGRYRRARLSPGGPHPRNHPHHLSENQPPKPDPVVCGRRISGRASTATISKISRPGISAAPANATSPPWSITRPISCSRAPRRRPIRCGAPRSSKNTEQGTRTATQYPATDLGQDQHRRWPMMPSS